jgi:hypothetical protein
MVSPTSLPTPGPLSPIDSQSTISLMSRPLGESGSVASTDILPSMETEHTTSLALSDAITRHSTPQPSVSLSQVIPSSSSPGSIMSVTDAASPQSSQNLMSDGHSDSDRTVPIVVGAVGISLFDSIRFYVW